MKKFISTSIAYINAEPHIGFLLELVAADVLARYHRLQGDEVFFLTGTDEHGTKVEQAAAAAGQAPQAYADQLAAKFKAVAEEFDIDFDYFVRTTDAKHIEFVQAAWQKLQAQGVLEKRAYDGWYCTGCEAFKTEREIVDGQCPIHHTALEKISEEDYFLLIDEPTKTKIREWVKTAVHPVGRQSEVINMLEEISDVSVSRPKDKLQWGIAVPGDETQVMYVWVDALLNYLSGIEAAGQKIEDWWPGIQLIGKDIVKFHAVIWPTLLLALGYELPEKLLVHGFINVDGQKMSKSLGNVIAPAELKQRYGVDATRYLLLRQLNFYDDSNFVWADFDALYNGELANGIGNLVQRTVSTLKTFNFEEVEAVLKKCLDWFEEEDIERELPVRWKRILNASLRDYDFSHIPRVLANRVLAAIDQEEQLFLNSPEPAFLETISLDQRTTDLAPWINKDQETRNKYYEYVVKDLFRISYFIEPLLPSTAAEIRRQLKELDPKPLFPRLEK